MNMTPEGKLLELIKQSAPSRPVVVPGRSSAKLRSIQRSLQQRMTSVYFNLRSLSWAQHLNRMFLIGSAACVVWTLWTLARAYGGPVGSGVASRVKGESPVRNPGHIIQLADLTRRNLFRPLIVTPPAPKIVVPVAPLPPPPPKIPLSQRVAHLRLEGIMDTTPAQAIIEDTRSQKTIYVSAGQQIDDVTVEKITKDQVILFSGDERFNLSM